MGADEEGTHEHLKAHLSELVNPKFEATFFVGLRKAGVPAE
jgi:hypothetical protein